MRWLRAGAVAVTVLSCWMSVAFITPSWHKLVFGVDWIDDRSPVLGMTEVEREQFDRTIVRYFVYGDTVRLDHDEQSHMSDVRHLWFGIVVLSMLGIAWFWSVKPLDVSKKALIVIALVGVLTLPVFGTAFSLAHTLFFPNGNWQFPEGSMLIEVYTGEFFVWMWATIVVVSALSLVGFDALHRKNRT